MNQKTDLLRVVILGGSGGIGRAFVDYFLQLERPVMIHATYHQSNLNNNTENCRWHCVDITDERQVSNFCDALDEIDICINAIGMLHNAQYQPEKSTQQISSDYFLHSMSTNALPTLLLARYISAKFRHKRPAVFATVSARVGSIEENYLGGWYSYRASKAALNMILKRLSIEWRRVLPNVAVAALHPGTTDTRLSQPFQQNVKPEQLFTPQQSVGYMMQVIDELTPAKTGKFWSFDGTLLPW